MGLVRTSSRKEIDLLGMDERDLICANHGRVENETWANQRAATMFFVEHRCSPKALETTHLLSSENCSLLSSENGSWSSSENGGWLLSENETAGCGSARIVWGAPLRRWETKGWEGILGKSRKMNGTAHWSVN